MDPFHCNLSEIDRYIPGTQICKTQFQCQLVGSVHMCEKVEVKGGSSACVCYGMPMLLSKLKDQVAFE